jgi:hypothetical protein
MTKNNNNKGRAGTRSNRSNNRSGTVGNVIVQGTGTGGRKAVVRGPMRRNMVATKDGVRVHFQDTLTYLTAPISGVSKTTVAIGGAFAAFPWMKNIALNYSKYRIHNLRFGFASTCPTTTSGDVTLAWVGDGNDAISWGATGSTESIFSIGKYVTGPTWSGTEINFSDSSLTLSIPSSQVHNSMAWFYVGVGAGYTDNTHYAGTLAIQVSYNSTTAITNAGRVFCEYDIEFTQPAYPGQNLFLTSDVNEIFSQDHPSVELPSHPPFPILSPLSTSPLSEEEKEILSIHRSKRSYDLASMV